MFGSTGTALPASVSASGTSTPLLNTGTALWAMSARNWWPVRTALVRSIGVVRLPSTSVVTSSAVPAMPSAPLFTRITTCGMPVGPRRKLP
ncbi:hypothetical protein D3C81_925320 [compost metagenome]